VIKAVGKNPAEAKWIDRVDVKGRWEGRGIGERTDGASQGKI